MSNYNCAETNHPCGRKLCRSYIVGFVLSALFTIVAFMLVEHKSLSNVGLYVTITVLAILQLFTQVLFFLRLNARTSNDRWNLISFLFTLLIMAIIVSGSLWIMYNLNYNMMSH